jgi:hypothetical protein
MNTSEWAEESGDNQIAVKSQSGLVPASASLRTDAAQPFLEIQS